MVTKAALALLAGSTGTCEHPEARSKVETHFPSERAHRKASVLHIYLPVIDTEPLRAMLLVTYTTGDDHGLFDFFRPFFFFTYLDLLRCSKSSTHLSISACF